MAVDRALEVLKMAFKIKGSRTLAGFKTTLVSWAARRISARKVVLGQRRAQGASHPGAYALLVGIHRD
jgi:hypothetical protein